MGAMAAPAVARTSSLEVVDLDHGLHGGQQRGDGCQGIGPPGHDHGELVTPEPGHRRPLRGRRLQPPGGVDQDGVPGPVAQGVVDVPEAVEVDHGHHDGGPVVVEGAAELLPEHDQVGEVGEAVVAGLAAVGADLGAEAPRGGQDQAEEHDVEHDEERGRRRGPGPGCRC